MWEKNQHNVRPIRLLGHRNEHCNGDYPTSKRSSSGKQDKKEKSKKNSLDDFKKQCEDLGFTPKTEKFGDCVLKLAEINNNS